MTTAAARAGWRAPPAADWLLVPLSALVVGALNWQHHYGWASWAGVVAVCCFAAAWVVLHRDARLAPNAPPCLVAVALLALGHVGFGTNGLSWFVWYLVQPVVIVPIAVLLLRYPYVRIRRRSDRIFVVVLAVWLFGSELVLATFYTPPAELNEWWPTLLHDGNRFGPSAVKVVDVVSIGFALVAIALIVRRVRDARGPDRSELLPVAGAGVTVALAAGVIEATWAFDLTRWVPDLDVAATLTYPLVPLAFLAAALRRRLARARIAELTTRIGAPGQPATGPEGLRRELAFALDDPSLEVGYWVEGRHLDADGRELVQASEDRHVVAVSAHDGTPLAVLHMDRSLVGQGDLVSAAVAAATLALENARLHTALLAQLAEVRSAQQRIVEAGVVERRRIERDLHDGAQQRLLAASMTLARAETESDAELLWVARDHVTRALSDLRDLARGIHPAILTQSGLAAAVDSVVELTELDVQLDIPASRWPPAVEATAYFVVAEALTNVAKHAPGASVAVRVTEVDEKLVVDVRDDGPGGAIVGGGSGLVGLTDRVRAIGGGLEVASRPGAGTELRAVIPCG